MQIGKYKLDNIYLADCYEAIKDIPDRSIDLIVTDPPFLIKNTTAGGHSQLAQSIQPMNNELQENEFTESIKSEILFPEIVRVMKAINFYVWCNGKQIPIYFDYFVKEQKCDFEIIVWRKTNAMPLFSNKYLTDKEYCLYFRKGGYCNPQNYEDAKTVWDLPINKRDKDKFSHPTIKPLGIVSATIRNSSRESDIVLDPFMGSGTTAVACKNLNRHYIGFENNPKWHKIATDRLNNIQANGQIGIFTD